MEPGANVAVAEASRADVPAVEAPRTDVTVVEAPGTDVPVVETPRTDVPVVETPRTDVPVVDAPRADVPVVDAPRTDDRRTGAPSQGMAGLLRLLRIPVGVARVPVVEATRTDGAEERQDLAKDANRLIVYLTRNGVTVRQEIISSVLTAEKALEEKSLSIEAWYKFLGAFSEIAKQAKPITAQSLVESDGSGIKSSIRHWSILVWLLLPILVVLSALSYSNSQFVTNGNKLIQDSKNDELRNFETIISGDANGARVQTQLGHSQ